MSKETLMIIKPDAYESSRDIISRISSRGFEITARKTVRMTKEQAAEFYQEHEGRPFYEGLVEHMASGLSRVVILRKGSDVVPQLRELMGATDPAASRAEESDQLDDSEWKLRSKYGTGLPQNAVHGSDSIESAAREIKFFWPEDRPTSSPAPPPETPADSSTVEATLAIIKPDAFHLNRSITARINRCKFDVIARKTVAISREQAAEFYQEHEGKGFYEGLINHMSSGLSRVYVLRRKGAITGWRDLIGPSNPDDARAQDAAKYPIDDTNWTLRARHGAGMPCNAVHGSDSLESAAREINFFFPSVEFNLSELEEPATVPAARPPSQIAPIRPSFPSAGVAAAPSPRSRLRRMQPAKTPDLTDMASEMTMPVAPGLTLDSLLEADKSAPSKAPIQSPSKAPRELDPVPEGEVEDTGAADERPDSLRPSTAGSLVSAQPLQFVSALGENPSRPSSASRPTSGLASRASGAPPTTTTESTAVDEAGGEEEEQEEQDGDDGEAARSTAGSPSGSVDGDGMEALSEASAGNLRDSLETKSDDLESGYDVASSVDMFQPGIQSDGTARRILVTGGAGYIGSHTVLELVENGYDVTIYDNLCNSKKESVRRVRELSGHADAIEFVEGDLLDFEATTAVTTLHKYYACIHFASLKAVGESVAKPLWYYENNITGTLNLLKALTAANCKRIVFSSSATVYGSAPPPVQESSQTGVGVTNPYGQTKFMLEQVLRDVQKSDPEWEVVLLRYFNPVGSHPSGRIGEDPNGIPNNLLPYIQKVAVGKLEKLTVYGDDWNTKDGTAERDFIHVVDLARGHVKTIGWLQDEERERKKTPAKDFKGVCEVFNLGTGKPHSVMEMLRGMERACGHEIPFAIGPRREGDLESVYAIADKARDVLGWIATKTLEDVCTDAWRWQSNNPDGLVEGQ